MKTSVSGDLMTNCASTDVLDASYKVCKIILVWASS